MSNSADGTISSTGKNVEPPVWEILEEQDLFESKDDVDLLRWARSYIRDLEAENKELRQRCGEDKK